MLASRPQSRPRHQQTLPNLCSLLSSQTVERDTRQIQELFLLKDALSEHGVEDPEIIDGCVRVFSQIPRLLRVYEESHPLIQTAELVWLCLMKSTLYHAHLGEICDVITGKLAVGTMASETPVPLGKEQHRLNVSTVLNALPCFKKVGLSIPQPDSTTRLRVTETNELWTLKPEKVVDFFTGQYGIPHMITQDAYPEVCLNDEREGSPKDAERWETFACLFKIMVRAGTAFIKESGVALPTPKSKSSLKAEVKYVVIKQTPPTPTEESNNEKDHGQKRCVASAAEEDNSQVVENPGKDQCTVLDVEDTQEPATPVENHSNIKVGCEGEMDQSSVVMAAQCATYDDVIGTEDLLMGSERIWELIEMADDEGDGDGEPLDNPVVIV